MSVGRQLILWMSIILVLSFILFSKLRDVSAIAEELLLDETPLSFREILAEPINSDINEFTSTQNLIKDSIQKEREERFTEVNSAKFNVPIKKPTLAIETHLVKKNENLWKIAQNSGLDAFTLLSVNKLRNGNLIRPGQSIKVPNQRGILHKVVKDESLEEIAIRYQVSLEKIIESNGMLDPDTIYTGTELFIPDAKLNESFRKKLIPPPYKPKFVKPTPGRLTSGFGYRIHPILKKRRMHKGIDIVSEYGSNVKAATGGVVTYSGQMGSYGNLVVIDHQNGFETRYAHNSRLKVKKGEKVHQGQTIALVGNTGRSNGTHLHFEIWKNGEAIDPAHYLK
ncbi:MAG: peptidoglycan DD-metalloendopeptidase family protein [Candidatus Poribacteria bacterium]|nr:peptidoglycan DD-metalloendopeptidase family protein [Candidatus Poribacteria bacterium]